MTSTNRTCIGLGLTIALGCAYPSASVHEGKAANPGAAGNPAAIAAIGAGSNAVESSGGAATVLATEAPIAASGGFIPAMATIAEGGAVASGSAVIASGGAVFPSGGAVGAFGGAQPTSPPASNGGAMPVTSPAAGGVVIATANASGGAITPTVVAIGGTTASPSTGTGGRSITASIVTGSGGNPAVTLVTGSGGTPKTSTTTAAMGGTTTVTSAKPTGTTVTFKAGKASGAMQGYAYVVMGTDDTVSDPTCGTDKTEITSKKACSTTTNWTPTDQLCVSGSVPVADTEWKSWGLAIGINATDPDTGTLGQKFTSIAIDFTGAPTSGLRATLHLQGDSESTSYCAEPVKSGTAVALTTFSTNCFDTLNPGMKLTLADVPNIDKVILQVSANDVSAVTVKNLCISGIKFAL